MKVSVGQNFSKVRLKFGSFIASAWARSLLARCESEMNGVVPDARSAATRIRDKAQVLFHEHEPSIPDAQTRSLIASCCVVLSAYREFRSTLTEAAAAQLVHAFVYRTYQRPARFLTGAWLFLVRDPLKRLRGDWWKVQSQRIYGAGMKFDQEETDNSVDLIVRRCAVHEFFLKHGEPALTCAFCAWDRNWMDVVDLVRSLRVERPTTISTGGNCCRFRLTRGDMPRQREPADVVLARLSPSASKVNVQSTQRRVEHS